MKAIMYYDNLPITHNDSLLDVMLPNPTAPQGRDLLVAIHAISVNPVDTKIRRNAKPEDANGRILGWDASGVVIACGPDVQFFKPGDAVFYAGALNRPGTNAEQHLVDERIVGRKPHNLSFAEAAALPLTAITAWELLFDRLDIHHSDNHDDEALLIIGAAGGVGSILTQLASRLTGITVIGTASRTDTAAWVKQLGADYVLDHSKPLAEELAKTGIQHVTHVASLTHSDQHFAACVDMLAPQGKFALIDDPETLDTNLLKRKSISFHWEFMFTRSLFQTPDMELQHHLLCEIAELVEAGIVKTTLNDHFGTINAENLKKAHALLESGKSKGKIVLEGF